VKNVKVGGKCGKSKGKKPIKNEKIPKMFTLTNIKELRGESTN